LKSEIQNIRNLTTILGACKNLLLMATKLPPNKKNGGFSTIELPTGDFTNLMENVISSLEFSIQAIDMHLVADVEQKQVFDEIQEILKGADFSAPSLVPISTQVEVRRGWEIRGNELNVSGEENTSVLFEFLHSLHQGKILSKETARKILEKRIKQKDSSTNDEHVLEGKILARILTAVEEAEKKEAETTKSNIQIFH
jgi:hypothetical protein